MEVGEWGGCDKPCQLATTKRVGGGGKKPGAGQVIPATISPHCQCPHQTYSYSLLKTLPEAQRTQGIEFKT